MKPTPQKRDTSAGFTLLEVLVVITMVGILLSMAVLSVGGQREKQLRHEIQRLQQVIRMAHEEAVLNQYLLAIRFSPHAYEFQAYEEDAWQVVSDPDFMRRREIEEDFELILRQDGSPVSLQDKEGGRVLLISSGEMTPFELELRLIDSDLSYRLTGSDYGELLIEGIDDADPSSEEG